jgi:hypothetical protein
MKVSKPVLIAALTVCVTNAWGQPANREPHIGYLYPGGGRQGTVLQITAGGQLLRGVNNVYVSGEGVDAKVIRYYRPVRNIQKEQREQLQRRLKELRQKRSAELSGDGSSMTPPAKERAKKSADKPKATKKEDAAKTKPVRPVRHPLLYNLEDKSLQELQHVAHEIFFPRWKKQLNTQIGEMVLIEISIDSDAAPGDRELRLETALGLTNPMVFQVGQLPEVCELEPNDSQAFANANVLKGPPVKLPVLLNGQIMPGDVDRFRFRARRGQQLVMQVYARRLVPYLADAVPGWFQATLALYDANGKEVAFADDYQFDPDPVLFYEIPSNGVYELEIRDSIYRGREDFVYRVAVGEQPFITGMYPLGGRSGVATEARITGWNLSSKRLPLDTQPGVERVRQTALRQDKWLTNRVTYAVDSMPEREEIEPNDTVRNAQRIVLPRIVNGRISRPDDVDVFRFKGHAGDEVVAEVCARRLNSPLDSLLRLTDASGTVLEWNDDNMHKDGHLHKDAGLLTHHADSYLSARLPKDGVYCIHLADSQRHGGDTRGYRLRVGPPQPDFELRMTPSSLTVPAWGAVPVCVHALRKDGFDGDIELVMKDAPDGFGLDGGRIPGGRDHVRMTLRAPQEALGRPVALRLEGRARIDGQTVSRPVVPSEDMMQAFLYRHLAPSQELLVSVTKPRFRARIFQQASSDPVRIPAGGTARVRVRAPKHPRLKEVQLELSEPPEGITLHNVTVVPVGLAFQVKADGDAVQVGFADNLIVEAFLETEAGNQPGKAPQQRRRVSLGVLPAIPFEILQR